MVAGGGDSLVHCGVGGFEDVDLVDFWGVGLIYFDG